MPLLISSRRWKSHAPPSGPLLLLTLIALLAGCATSSTGTFGRYTGPLPPDVDEEVLEGGAVAEAHLALSRIWSVVGGVREVGSRLSFTFWSERGALTLTSYSASGRGGPLGHSVDEDAVQEDLAHVLTRFAQRHTGMVQLTLERHVMGWTVSYSLSAKPRPSEAKTLPVRRAGLPSFFEAYSHYLETLVALPEGRERGVSLLTFPWDVPHILGQDRGLVELIQSGRLDLLMPRLDARGWARTVVEAGLSRT